MARESLAAMARGGIRDHVGGGFHRYSTDARWLVPHFEKMLYDNALLARAYLEGYQATGEALFARVATETLDYVLREMTAAGGGFFSSSDADSEGREGRYYVWTPEEIRDVLGAEDAALFCAWYDIRDGGHVDGRSIPNRLLPEELVIGRLGASVESRQTLAQVVDRARARVLQARRRREAPALDDKILTGWNGLMIGALAEGARVLGEPRYLQAAERAASFVLRHLRSPNGRLLRSYRQGQSQIDAFLEDYAYLAEGLLDLYEAGGVTESLHTALALAERGAEDFVTEGGALASTSREHEGLLLRPRDGHDGATPSANATMAHVLARLSYLFDRGDLRHAAWRAIEAYGENMATHPRAFPKALMTLDLLLDGPVELCFVAGDEEREHDRLMREVAWVYLPRRVIAHARGPSSSGAPEVPLLAGKLSSSGRPTLHVCSAGSCHPPIERPKDVVRALATWSEAAAALPPATAEIGVSRAGS
jgi:hypothetical protein